MATSAILLLILACGVACALGFFVGRNLERIQVASQQATLQTLQLEQEREIARLRQHIQNQEAHAQQLLARLREVELELVAQKTQATEAQHFEGERMRLLSDARSELRAEFKQLSQQIFEEKTEKLSQHSQKLFDATLTPLREQLFDFKKTVEGVYLQDSKDRSLLLAQVQQLQHLNQTLGQQALNLTQALKGQSQLRGAWGEQTLTTLLEASGLVHGTEYELQKSLRSDDGKRRVPDVIIHLPDKRDVIIDSKVSLNAYLEYCSSEDDAVRQAAVSAHISSLRGHISDLAEKDYAALLAGQAIDFVLLFVPIEPALLLVLQQDSALFTDAYRRKIIIVGPSTLLATLRTIEGIWRVERQSKNAEEIARRAAELWDQMALSLESLLALGRHLGQAQIAFEDTLKRLHTGRGNLKKRAEALRQLGVKGKRELPAALLDRLEAFDDNESDEKSATAEHAAPFSTALTS